jgi:hypothetical protein
MLFKKTKKILLYKMVQLKGGDYRRTLRLKLPKYPTTSNQLRFVRHWLRQLSQAHFKFGVYERDVLNPEYIAMVFPPDEAGHEENFCLSFDTIQVKKVLKFKKFSIH